MKNSKFNLPIKLEKSYVVFLVIFSVAVYLISLIFPYIFKYIIDNVNIKQSNNLYLYIIGIFLFSIFVHGINYLCDYLNQLFCNRTVLKYQKEIVKKISTINIPDYENEEKNYTKLFAKQENAIEIKNVAITNEKKELLFEIEDLTISKNGLYILKGDNGTGKTTLFNLLSGVYSINQINQDNGYFRISETQKDDISYLYNPVMLFNGSVKENIILSETESKEDILKMRKLLNIFNAKDENYEVKTNPSNLSLGEQQKLFLIRTFMQDKGIILLDEPSENLDVYSKVILKEFLKIQKENHIIILISHDLLYEEIADRIYYISNKKLS